MHTNKLRNSINARHFVIAFSAAILASCTTYPPLLDSQKSTLRDRRSLIASALKEAESFSRKTSNDVFLIATDGETATPFRAESIAAANRQLVSQSPQLHSNTTCIYYFPDNLAIAPHEVPCEDVLLQIHRAENVQIALAQLEALRRELGALETILDEIDPVLSGSVELGIINNSELVEARSDLHNLHALLDGRDQRISELKSKNDAFILEIREKIENLESLIRAGIPQYE